MESDRAGRYNALDGLRGIAAAGVVLLHVWMYSGRGRGEGGPTLIDQIAREARLGVVLFFVLSGFLLYRPWVSAALDGRVSPRLSTYALRRAARILPAYWFALAGAFALTRALDHPLAREPEQLWIYALMVQNQFASAAGGIDPPMWSLGIEASFYVALPLLCLVAVLLGGGARRGIRHGTAVQLACCGLLVALGVALNTADHLGDWPRTTTSSLPFFVQYFALGMAAAVVVHRRSWSRRVGIALVLLGCALVVADGAWHVRPHLPLRHELRDVPAALGFALVIAALVAAPLRARLLTCAPIALLGTLSYGIYLWHFPAIILLRNRDLWPDGMWPRFAAVMALSAAVAAISWLLVERPILRWAQRR
ncbi:acyltransferase family protein [Conexibacter arvalis]|uniref:Peptidoglycan/LPS O-acetylase OafA/YrhL n=1 Tax=Conexibacter arvalis TaxID=912552 RepID=A0A840IBZ8_9ACTN|nr:acyltransferase [Conexibacter arvalis]MBB4661460.1 peptidoglycan/LPS O-acetylase OafA/YrhL [Conexibacter arvalis]